MFGLSMRRKAPLDKAHDEGGAGGAPRLKRSIGLALGSGVARGWAHIGVLAELEDAGLAPDIVCGSSIGAVVGGAFAAGKLAEMEEFARSTTLRRMFGMLDVSLGGGLFGGKRLEARLAQSLGGMKIEDLPRKFAAVATEVGTGHEIWLSRGDLVTAMRASYALPGVFEPVRMDGRWLFDGALTNPVPITACRALGADLVVAVNLNADSVGRGTVIQDHVRLQASHLGAGQEPTSERGRMIAGGGGSLGMATVMVDAFNITQDRITRSRLAGDPPDVMLSVKAGRIGLFEFHRADEAIACGREAARRALDDIREQIGQMAAL
jgi:NTE family protein